LLVGSQGDQRGFENGGGRGIGWRNDAVVHPLAFAARGNDSGPAQIGQMARDLGLPLAQYFNEVADTNFASGHQVEQTQPGGVRERRKKNVKGNRFAELRHAAIIYGLTDMMLGNIFA